MKAQKCPACGQPLSSGTAEARLKHYLGKLLARETAGLKRKEATLRAQMVRDTANAERAARASARQAYQNKLREAEIRRRSEISAAVGRAREEEQRKTNRQVEQMRKHIREQERRFERMSSADRGEMGEAGVLQTLRRAFPDDEIQRVGKGGGAADIRHEVRDQGRSCGVIVYECKDVTKWNGSFLRQARAARSLYRASHAIVVSSAFPAGEKYLAFDKDVAIVHPSIVAKVVVVLRQSMVVMASASGTQAERARKADLLLQLVKGEDFQRNMKGVAEAAAELLGLQTEERRSHARVWENQALLIHSIQEKQALIQGRVAQILSGAPLALIPDETRETSAVG